jgi:hypothetical protein
MDEPRHAPASRRRFGLLAGSSIASLLGTGFAAGGEAKRKRNKRCKKCSACQRCRKGACTPKPNGAACGGGGETCQDGFCLCPAGFVGVDNTTCAVFCTITTDDSICRGDNLNCKCSHILPDIQFCVEYDGNCFDAPTCDITADCPPGFLCDLGSGTDESCAGRCLPSCGVPPS